jgi:hypothetical protein
VTVLHVVIAYRLPSAADVIAAAVVAGALVVVAYAWRTWAR